MIMNKKMLIKMMQNSGSEISYSHGLKMFEALFVASCHARKNFYTQTPLHTEPFKQRRLYTQTLWHTAAFTQKLLYRAAVTQSRFYAHAFFTYRSFYARKLLHREAFTQSSFCTPTEALHADTFTHRSFYTRPKLVHSLCAEKSLHRAAFAHKRLHKQKPLHRACFTRKCFLREAVTQTSFYTLTLLREDAFAHFSFYAPQSRTLISPQFPTFNHHLAQKGCAGCVKRSISP